jgi:hypothetical protein
MVSGTAPNGAGRPCARCLPPTQPRIHSLRRQFHPGPRRGRTADSRAVAGGGRDHTAHERIRVAGVDSYFDRDPGPKRAVPPGAHACSRTAMTHHEPLPGAQVVTNPQRPTATHALRLETSRAPAQPRFMASRRVPSWCSRFSTDLAIGPLISNRLHIPGSWSRAGFKRKKGAQGSQPPSWIGACPAR